MILMCLASEYLHKFHVYKIIVTKLKFVTIDQWGVMLAPLIDCVTVVIVATSDSDACDACCFRPEK